MKKSNLISSVAVAALLVALPITTPAFVPAGAPAVAAQDVRVSISIFFDELRPHGVWVKHKRYKFVWCPKVDSR